MNVRDLAKALYLLQQEDTTVAAVGQGPAVALGQIPSTNKKHRKGRCGKCKSPFSPQCRCPNVKGEGWSMAGYDNFGLEDWPGGQVPPEATPDDVAAFARLDALVQTSQRFQAQYARLMQDAVRQPFGADNVLYALTQFAYTLSPKTAGSTRSAWAHQQLAKAVRQYRASGQGW